MAAVGFKLHRTSQEGYSNTNGLALVAAAEATTASEVPDEVRER
jgi:hypothetical protein